MSDIENKQTGSEPELTAEQAAQLARVERIESEILPTGADSESAPAADGGAMVAADAGAENAAILGLLVEMLIPAAPFLAECYTPPVIQRIALAYTAVEQKRGWNARAFLSVEAQLAIVALPPTIQAFVLGREYLRQRAIENKLPWWLKWFKRKKPEPVKLGGDPPPEEGA